jgi:hypothetical protein
MNAAGTIAEIRERIAALEGEIVWLKAQLQTVGISEAERVAILTLITENTNQINTLENQITTLLPALLAQPPNPNPLTGKTHVSSID